ncbi:peptidoglycan-binding domain-containing protein [Bacillus thuringiensis]|uniref:peptidoglycan-binding domain-containing protein n=1 Tax=Bacillus thuringiensis TaxID=1428 RepID=UPI000BFE066D|nr:peptidoglycan-binding domain-containing protein [Bacillus thuringiensis]PGQ50534.1 hypothetical protein COA20_02230 [Bacillus thuringiensis]
METKKPVGELALSVHKEGNLAPISDVQVEIRDTNENLIRILKTDKFGNAEQIKLLALSNKIRLGDGVGQNQYMLSQGKYNIIIKHPGYHPVRIENLAISKNSVAIPEIKLTSLNNNRERISYKVLVMEDPKPSNEKKFLNPYNISESVLISTQLAHTHGHGRCGGCFGGEFSGLPIGLIIPEFVKVNLDSSRTVKVPFVDYIKGVVHAEIRGFIEDEAIKTNIIVIVSFVLNRIFTEHYKRQNKDFHITNDTSVDQGYLENYTAEAPLIRNVEDFFNHYVEYPGDRNFPFLTQYCNGTSVKCANQNKLEQVGCIELAKQGKKYKDILKHYYGSNFNTISATHILLNGDFYSFIKSINLGDSGSEVEECQKYLEVIGKEYDIPVITKAVEELGEFGEKTDKSVRLFQKVVMRLSVEKINGVIDQKTWYLILTRYLIIVDSHRNIRNYIVHDAPPQDIPVLKIKFRCDFDLFEYLGNWVYIWKIIEGNEVGFWFWPSYIGILDILGYIWKDGVGESTTVKVDDIYAYFPEANKF